MKRQTVSFGEAATGLETILASLNGRPVNMQQTLDLVVVAVQHQIALLRFLEREFPDADKIREAVFEVRK